MTYKELVLEPIPMRRSVINMILDPKHMKEWPSVVSPSSIHPDMVRGLAHLGYPRKTNRNITRKSRN